MANTKDIINRSTFRTIYAPEVKQTITVSVDGYKWDDDDSKAAALAYIEEYRPARVQRAELYNFNRRH